MNARYLGIEIGGSKLVLSVGDDDANVVDQCRETVDRAQGGAGIRARIEEGFRQFSQKHSLVAAGCGFGGPIDVRTGRIALSHQVEGWADFELRAWIERISGLPAQVDNDANTAALGETYGGAGAGFRRVFYVTLGSGMGGGMTVDGRIYHGATPGESEIGLMAVDRDGKENFESRCCGWAVDRKIRTHIQAHADGWLAKLAGGETGGEAKHLAEALRRGDAAALAILDDTAGDIAFALSHVVHLFHPELLILGGGLSLIGEPLRASVAGHLPGLLTRAFRPGPPVKLAVLGEGAVSVGAILLAQGKGLGG